MMAKFKTDLHTHLPGVLNPDELVKLGLQHNVAIPITHLQRMGIPVENFSTIEGKEGAAVLLTDIVNSDYIDKYKTNLSMSTEHQNIFPDMDSAYDFRDPFIKPNYSHHPDKSKEEIHELDDKKMGDVFRAIALKYKEQGIEYVELSTTKFGPEHIAQFHKYLPEIEKETGVQLDRDRSKYRKYRKKVPKVS